MMKGKRNSMKQKHNQIYSERVALIEKLRNLKQNFAMLRALNREQITNYLRNKTVTALSAENVNCIKRIVKLQEKSCLVSINKRKIHLYF